MKQLELIDRNLLILNLKRLEVDVNGLIRPTRAAYLKRAIKDFIETDIVDLIRKQQCIKLDENLIEKIVSDLKM